MHSAERVSTWLPLGVEHAVLNLVLQMKSSSERGLLLRQADAGTDLAKANVEAEAAQYVRQPRRSKHQPRIELRRKRTVRRPPNGTPIANAPRPH